MSIRDILRVWLCNKPIEPIEPVARPFTTLNKVSGGHVYIVLHDAFPDAHIRMADEEYTTTTLDEFNAWLRDDMVSERRYYRGWSDCDNFARDLRCAMFKINRTYKTEFTMPYTEGMSPGGYHAFDIFLDSEDNVYVVEPQDDNVVPYYKSSYTPDFIQL